MRLSLRAHPTQSFFEEGKDHYYSGNEDGFNSESEFQSERTVLKDVTNFDLQDFRTLTEENDMMRSNIEDQYLKARSLLIEAEKNGWEVSIRMLNELDDLKKDNHHKVHRLENLLIDLESVTCENRTLIEKLDSKVRRVQHLQVYLKNMEKSQSKIGEKVLSTLNRKQNQNSDLQWRIEELKAEIDCLSKKSASLDKKASSLSSQWKDLMNSKGQRMDNLKTLSKEIMEIRDKISESQHLISLLQKKNKKREKEVKMMAEKAEELAKKYSELKEKAIRGQKIFLQNSKEFNSAVGSRLMAYKLHSLYLRKLKEGTTLLRENLTFKKEAEKAVEGLSRIHTMKWNDNCRLAFYIWHHNALQTLKNAKLPKRIKKSINEEKKQFMQILKSDEKQRKGLRQSILVNSAKDRMQRVFEAMTLREKKRMFDCWRDSLVDDWNKRQALKSILNRTHIKRLFIGFKKWNNQAYSVDQSYKMQFFIREESELQYLQGIFSGLKNITSVKKHKKILLLRKAFDILQMETRRWITLKRVSKIFKQLNDQKKFQKIQYAFDELKINKELKNAKNYQTELSKIIPLREKAENMLRNEVNRTDIYRLTSSCQIIHSWLGRYVQSYLTHWKNVIKSKDSSIKYLFLSKFIKAQYHWVYKEAFLKWRKRTQKMKKDSIQYIVNKNESENALLIQTCKNLVNDVNSIALSTKTKAILKVYKLMKAQHDHLNCTYFRRWKNNWVRISEKAKPLIKLWDLLRQHYLKVAFHHYKNQIQKARKAEVVNVRMNFALNSKKTQLKIEVFGILEENANHSKRARKLILSIFSHQEKNKISEVFESWTRITRKAYEHDQKILKENIKHTISSNEKVKAKITDHHCRIKEGTQNLENKFLSQSQSVLSNALVRLLTNSVDRAFHKWRKATVTRSLQSKSLSKLVNSLIISEYRSSFQIWQSFLHSASFSVHRSSLSLQLSHNSSLLSQQSTKLSIQTTQTSTLSTTISHLHSSSKSHSIFLQSFTNHLSHLASTSISTPKLYLHFHAWKHLTCHKKSTLNKFFKIIERKLCQKLLTGVKWVANTRTYVCKRRKVMGRLLQKKYREE
jgi:hypothetical protein